jgi:hypothetical protein
MDFGYIKTILSHAAALHGVTVAIEPIDLARAALCRLGLVGKGDERDRRPTQDKLNRLVASFDANPRQQIPMGRIIEFAVATAMRQAETCRIEYSDFDADERMLLIRDRKVPRRKNGNHQRIPLLSATGYDACALIDKQCAFLGKRKGRIFPYNSRSVGTAFRRGEMSASVDDLRQLFDELGIPRPEIHRGWFRDVLPQQLPEAIAFAHLDSDFYESIKWSLQSVWPRLRQLGRSGWQFSYSSIPCSNRQRGERRNLPRRSVHQIGEPRLEALSRHLETRQLARALAL